MGYIKINSSATASTRVNDSGPSVPVNKFKLPQTGDITFSDSDFQFSIPGYARTGFTARSSAGFVEFKTFETSIDIKIGGNWSIGTSGSSSQSECVVLVNSVYNQSVILTSDNTTQTYAITLPSGLKTIKLVNGYTANQLAGSITLPNAGVYVQGINTTGNIEIVVPPIVADKKLFIGDSITTGASGTHPSITGFTGLFRSQDNWKTQTDAYGNRRILTSDTTLGNEMATIVSAQMTGTVLNEVFMLLGTNNFTVGGGHSKALFKSCIEIFLDTLHAIRPDIIIYLVSPINRPTYSTPNSQGATLEDYYDAEVEAASTRSSWTKVIYGKNLISLSNMADGPQVHPNQTGMQEIHDKLLIEYNLLQ